MNAIAQRTRERGWLSYVKTAVLAGIAGSVVAAAPALAADELPLFRQVAKADVTTSLRTVHLPSVWSVRCLNDLFGWTVWTGGF